MRPFRAPQVLLPCSNIDLTKWSVVACDQFTSQPDYWQKVSSLVGNHPSTLRLIYPEAYIGKTDFNKEIENISSAMRDYLRQGYLVPHQGYILCERTLTTGKKRKGLLVELDLERYDPFGKLDVRASERTVRERLPLRMDIRRDALLELPHILVLLDDPEKRVIEPLFEEKGKQLYSFTLNMDGGSLSGYETNAEEVESLFDAFTSARSKESASFSLAVGDGNHSLAAARECWLEIKKNLSEEQALVHPARYALVEIVNLFDDSLAFEPIHRVIYGADADFLANFPCDDQGREIDLYDKGVLKKVTLDGSSPEIIARIQAYLDEYVAANPSAKQDYIHGLEHLLSVSAQGVAIVMPAVDKESMFTYLDANGVLTRKAFSMGEAEDKKYYMECRRIKPIQED